MKHIMKTTATYQMKAFADTDKIDITEDDIIIGPDDNANVWVLVKQKQGRHF